MPAESWSDQVDNASQTPVMGRGVQPKAVRDQLDQSFKKHVAASSQTPWHPSMGTPPPTQTLTPSPGLPGRKMAVRQGLHR